jgi:signal transduction histidine kinase
VFPVVPEGPSGRNVSDPGARLPGLLAGLGAIVWEAERDTGAFTFVGAGGDPLGYPRECWLGDPGFRTRLIHGDDRARTLAHYHAAGAGSEVTEIAFRALTADGRVVAVRDRIDARHGARLRGVMLPVPAHEIAVAADALPRAEARAETAERRTAFLAEATQALAGSLDFDATLRRVAKLCVPYLADWCAIDVTDGDDGFRRVALVHADPVRAEAAATLRRRFRPDPHAGPGLAHALTTGAVQWRARGSDPAHLVADGDARQVAAFAELGVRGYICVPMVAHGRTLGAITLVSATDGRYGDGDVVVARDLAHRAAVAVDNGLLYREGQETNRRKDEFLASLSHELRTPLTAMLGWLRLLRAGTLDPDAVAHALETIERNARVQTQLIEDLLDVSRLIMNKTYIDRRPVSVAAVVKAAIAARAPAAHGKGVEMHVAVEDEQPTVLGDEGRLRQVVENLLSNAVKFTPSGGRVLVRLDADDSHATITVSDTGEGIPESFLPYVFDHFRQARHVGPQPQAGLGLGLAIARGLVELHGGTVAAHSEGRGRGARFTVRLPRAA